MGRHKVELQERQPVPLARIAAGPPRHSEAAVEDMRQALATQGQRQPVLVLAGRDGAVHRLIAGRRRYLAAERLGWRELDAIVLDPEADTLAANLVRQQQDRATPWQVADTLAALKDRYGWTQAHLGLAIGRTRDYVATMLSLQQIAPEVRHYLESHPEAHRVTLRHLRFIARVPVNEQMRAAQESVVDRLSSGALEQRKQGSNGRAAKPLIRLREFRRKGSPTYPTSQKEWRAYYRQLRTDLRRLEQQEQEEKRKAREMLMQAKARQRALRKEVTQKRRQLDRELKQVMKHLT